MIGIVGGVGPVAGADLLKKITEETMAAKDQQHLPVILFSLPQYICDRTDFLEGKTNVNPGLALADICLQLENSGATVVGIPCNTAHAPAIMEAITGKLKAAGSKIILTHLIEENIIHLKKNFKPDTKIAVLSTTGTYRQKIYSGKIINAGFECLTPDEEVQNELVHAAIYHKQYGIKSNSREITTLAKEQIRYVMDMMKEKGAEAILLGCTELPLAIPEKTYRGMPLIDATRVLARAMIRNYDEKKLAPWH